MFVLETKITYVQTNGNWQQEKENENVEGKL